MADIIVTVPKDQVDHFKNDKVPSIDAWWTVAKRPRHLEGGDFIGFVFEGAIRYAAEITHLQETDIGKWEIHFQDCGWIKPIHHEHFRGFRYYGIAPDVSRETLEGSTR